MRNKRIVIGGESVGIYLNEGVTKTKIESENFKGYGYSNKEYQYKSGAKTAKLDKTDKVKITGKAKQAAQNKAAVMTEIFDHQLKAKTKAEATPDKIETYDSYYIKAGRAGKTPVSAKQFNRNRKRRNFKQWLLKEYRVI